MPELPEVETIRRVLLPYLKNAVIESARVDDAAIAYPSPARFVGLVEGQRIKDIERRGKFLRFVLEKGVMTLHLRMTGCLTLVPQGTPDPPHLRAVFFLSSGRRLNFEDVRRFGRLWFTSAGEADVSGAEKLGIEPFDGALTVEFLAEKCKNRKRTVKQLLLDQSVIAGIGNIYSDEILFSAGIRPDRTCASLEREELARLAAAIPERLEYFVEKNALDLKEHNAGKGREYRNTPFLQVYGRGGEKCVKCAEELQRIVICGRSSIFCPHCQK